MFTPTIATTIHTMAAAAAAAALQTPSPPRLAAPPHTTAAIHRENGPSLEKFHPRRARFSLLKAN